MSYNITQVKVLRRLDHGRKLVVRGKLHENSASIVLSAGHHPHNPMHHVPLCITMHPHEHCLAFNASKQGHWANEVRVSAAVHEHKHFTIEVRVKNEHFDIHFDGSSIHVFEPHHGYHLHDITHMLIEGHVHIDDIIEEC